MKALTKLLLTAFMLCFFTSFTYAEAVTTPGSVNVTTPSNPLDAQTDMTINSSNTESPIPFVDQGLVFITLQDLSADLSKQVAIDFNVLKTKDKKIYTFNNGFMTQLKLPLIWKDGHFGFQVGSNYSGVLCNLTVNEKKGLYSTQVALKKQGDGTYLATINTTYENLKSLPQNFNLILVSRAIPIDGDLKFSLTKLSALEIARTSDMSVNAEIGLPLQNMFKASSSANSFKLNVVSGFRTVAKQRYLFNNKMAILKSQGVADPFEVASKTVNPPTQSEHHTGYAVDILSTRVTGLGAFKGTSEAKWLEANSYKYGFVVRYPNGKTGITGISYEPWHFRYVGKEYAKVLKENKLTLEEWLTQGKKGTLYTSINGKQHYFVVVSSDLTAQANRSGAQASETKRYYISPGWAAYDIVIPE